MPTRWLSIGFLVVLGVAAAEVSQITGSLLVFSPTGAPARRGATRLSVRPAVSFGLGILIALLVTWFGLAAAFFSPYPSGFWISTLAFGVFVVASLRARLR